MKAADLFLLINEIDERLIDDAENDIRAEKVTIKSGLPIKEIIAFAACFAVLAAGIFAIVKFRINEDIPAVSNDPMTVSSDGSSYNESDNSDESTVSDPERPQKDPEMVKDTAFAHIIQPYLKKGSFPDTLRGIMLRAATVEELEAQIHAADTENKVTSILVTMPSPPEYNISVIPVTSGEITEGMTIQVTYTDDGQPDERTGVTYIVGKFFDEYYGQIISQGDFEILMMNAVESSGTVEELNEKLAGIDIHDRIIEVHVYADTELKDEITSGALKNGMAVYINYDNDSWMQAAVFRPDESGGSMSVFERFWQLDIDPSYIGLEKSMDLSRYADNLCEPVGMRPFADLGVDGTHFGFIEGFGEMVFSVEPRADAGNEVHPIANNFEDFLRVVLAGKGAHRAAQIRWIYKESFEDYDLRQNDDPAMAEIYSKTEETLAAVQAGLGLEPMTDAYDYVRGIQETFDYTKIKYSNNYYEMTGSSKPE